MPFHVHIHHALTGWTDEERHVKPYQETGNALTRYDAMQLVEAPGASFKRSKLGSHMMFSPEVSLTDSRLRYYIYIY